MNTTITKQLDDLFRVWDNGLCPVSYTHLTLPTTERV